MVKLKHMTIPIGYTTTKESNQQEQGHDSEAEAPDCSYILHNHKGRYLAGVGSLMVKLMMAKLKRLTTPIDYTTTKGKEQKKEKERKKMWKGKVKKKK